MSRGRTHLPNMILVEGHPTKWLSEFQEGVVKSWLIDLLKGADKLEELSKVLVALGPLASKCGSPGFAQDFGKYV